MKLKFNIEAIKVFLERRKTRLFVGSLFKENGNFVFIYDDNYLAQRSAFALGPELSLTKRRYESYTLFPSFEDRIPSRRNPAYKDYCYSKGIDPAERDELVLLATIGSRGPSSFIFTPVYDRSFTALDVVKYRKDLGLSTREFAKIFEISQPALNALERNRTSGHDLLKKLEIIVKFPEVALYHIFNNGGILQHDKREKALEYLVNSAKLNEHSDIKRFLESKD